MALDSFAADFDGFVIDVAELTQLMLGMDAGNVTVKAYYDDKHPAVLAYLEMALGAAKKLKKPAGLVNIPPGAVAHYAQQKVTHSAQYVAFRPEVYATAREELLQGQAKAK
jgi:phosphoenolpyruvate synthase/pyruvate phosphate dikinase